MDRSERTKINRLLKSVEPEKVDAVRGMIKNASFDDAITVINAFTGQNKPVSDSDHGNIPINTKTSENKPVTASDNQLERVKDSPTFDIDEISLKVRESIQVYCLQHDMENIDMIKAPQRIWGACSSFIGKNVFKASGVLKQTKLKQAPGQPFLTTNNALDIDRVVSAINLYIDLCNEYNKAVLVDYIALFCGVSDSWLYENSEKLTALGMDLPKKREQSLTASLVDGKINPTGTIATLNHFHGWTTGHTHTEKKETVVIYPVLSGDIKSDNLIASTENN